MARQTPREIVRRTLMFEHPERVPVHLWVLPWATEHYPQEVAALLRDYPSDIAGAPAAGISKRSRGNPYAVGTFVDDWGCVFENLQAGVIGEVKTPQIAELENWRHAEPPWELVPNGEEAERRKKHIDDFCRNTDRFVLSGCCPRPWERYQFLRGSENALCDMADPTPESEALLERIFGFYCRELTFWAQTSVDALSFMDDWGSQRTLLIAPETWRRVFKPMYREFCRIARDHGKFIFMHSDGQIADIYPDLIEIGVSAVNSQLFCMDMDRLAATGKGKITFWGEIDRQHVLCSPDPEEGRRAVRKIVEKLYSPSGGVFCQFELGPGVNPAVARAVCEEWTRLTSQK